MTILRHTQSLFSRSHGGGLFLCGSFSFACLSNSVRGPHRLAGSEPLPRVSEARLVKSIVVGRFFCFSFSLSRLSLFRLIVVPRMTVHPFSPIVESWPCFCFGIGNRAQTGNNCRYRAACSCIQRRLTLCVAAPFSANDHRELKGSVLTILGPALMKGGAKPLHKKPLARPRKPV